VTIGHVWIDGAPYTDFDAAGLTVRLPVSDKRHAVKVRLQPREG
jgi:hypothetical protein